VNRKRCNEPYRRYLLYLYHLSNLYQVAIPRAIGEVEAVQITGRMRPTLGSSVRVVG
jgi:hypothetical protein